MRGKQAPQMKNSRNIIIESLKCRPPDATRGGIVTPPDATFDAMKPPLWAETESRTQVVNRARPGMYKTPSCRATEKPFLRAVEPPGGGRAPRVPFRCPRSGTTIERGRQPPAP